MITFFLTSYFKRNDQLCILLRILSLILSTRQYFAYENFFISKGKKITSNVRSIWSIRLESACLTCLDTNFIYVYIINNTLGDVPSDLLLGIWKLDSLSVWRTLRTQPLLGEESYYVIDFGIFFLPVIFVWLEKYIW